MNYLAAGIFRFIFICSLFTVFYGSAKMAESTGDSSAKIAKPIDEPPYGVWRLLNPASMGMSSGGLMICKEEDKESCNGGDVSFVVLDRDAGHGCTDYVGVGTIKKSTADGQWQIYMNNDLTDQKKMWATARQTGADDLVLVIAGDNFTFVRSTRDSIDEETYKGCRASSERNIKNKDKSTGEKDKHAR